ncbi:MAG: hypothetical protein K8S98_01860 [Planctomycetes bacterium]|nr:hypothetical protein [Planctomycetota bacterium]
MPKFAKRFLIALVSVVVFFGAAEELLRWNGFEYPPIEPIQVWNRLEDRDIRLGKSMHEYAERQLWRPNAGAEIPWGGTVNELGYRGPVLKKEKTPGVLRIATMGDSSTFGHSVKYEETYSAQLEQMLNGAGVRCEVLDAGVVGFTIRQGLERYDELVREFHPDIVIEAFGAVNDHLQAIQSVADKDKIAMRIAAGGFWTQMAMTLRQQSRLVHYAAKLADQSKGTTSNDRDKIFKQRRRENEIDSLVGRLDFVGMRRVPLDDFELCLLEFQRRVEADGGRLILMSMPRQPAVEKASPVLVQYSQKVAEIGARQGLVVVDGRAVFQAALAADASKVEQLFADSYHPKPAGHRLLAQELAKAIVAQSKPAK